MERETGVSIPHEAQMLILLTFMSQACWFVHTIAPKLHICPFWIMQAMVCTLGKLGSFRARGLCRPWLCIFEVQNRAAGPSRYARYRYARAATVMHELKAAGCPAATPPTPPC